MKPLEDCSDEELHQLAELGISAVQQLETIPTDGVGAFTNVSKANALLRQLKETRDALRASRGEANGAAQMIQSLHEQLERVNVELAEKKAALRLTDPDNVRRRIGDAVARGHAAATARGNDELAKLRAEVAEQRSQIEELRASKKKLREALDRATR